MASMTRRSGRTPNCRSSRSIGAVMTANMAAELDAFCIVWVLFVSGTCHAPNRLRGPTLQDATGGRYPIVKQRTCRPAPAATCRGALTVKAGPHGLTRTYLLTCGEPGWLEYARPHRPFGLFARGVLRFCNSGYSMIPKSGYRFSEKIMLKDRARAADGTKSARGPVTRRADGTLG